MKHTRRPRKLALETESLRHLRMLETEQLGAMRGGLPAHPMTAGVDLCPKTTGG